MSFSVVVDGLGGLSVRGSVGRNVGMGGIWIGGVSGES